MKHSIKRAMKGFSMDNQEVPEGAKNKSINYTSCFGCL